jgi:hypothetical protein
VRLRVHEASRGALTPWHLSRITAPVFFFEGEGTPDDAAPPPQAQLDPQAQQLLDRPLAALSPDQAYSVVLERDTIEAYQQFIAAFPNHALAKRVRLLLAERREALIWRRTVAANTPPAYWSYLRRYPRGPHAPEARRRLAALTAPAAPPPDFAMMDYDVPPPPPDEVVYVDRPVLMFSDPEFDFAPPPPPPIFFLPPPPPDFVILAPPIVAVGLFILPQPYFVPIPVYVQPPVYVVPPPNNIIFANIHNTTVINNVINQPPQAQCATRPVARRQGRAGAGRCGNRRHRRHRCTGSDPADGDEKGLGDPEG